jgi:DHA2 family multidrug resistance protein-like MFS transporter
VISLALAPVLSLTTELIVGSAPPERSGAASALAETGGELGAALGIAILGSIGAIVYRFQLTSRLANGFPVEIAAVATDTLGAAVAAAGQLSGPLGSTLLSVAREAFVQGMHVVAIISATVAVGAAIAIMILLRHAPAHSAPEEHAKAETALAHAPTSSQHGGCAGD